MTGQLQYSLLDARSVAAWPWGDHPAQAYGLIMADPPWAFDLYSEKGAAKSASSHYATMSTAAIEMLPVGLLPAKDAVLWLWATWPRLPDALRVMDAWGFRYVTGGAWDKKRWGTGYVLRSVCEPFLIGFCGEPRVDGAKLPNIIHETRRQHSRKPEGAYAAAERMIGDARRIELFSRTSRPGWDAWGDEAGKLGEVGQ